MTHSTLLTSNDVDAYIARLDTGFIDNFAYEVLDRDNIHGPLPGQKTMYIEPKLRREYYNKLRAAYSRSNIKNKDNPLKPLFAKMVSANVITGTYHCCTFQALYPLLDNSERFQSVFTLIDSGIYCFHSVDVEYGKANLFDFLDVWFSDNNTDDYDRAFVVQHIQSTRKWTDMMYDDEDKLFRLTDVQRWYGCINDVTRILKKMKLLLHGNPIAKDFIAFAKALEEE